MGVVSLAGRIVLVVTNIVLLLLSLVMMAIGIVIVAGKDVYNSLVSSFQEQLNAANTQLGTTVDTGDLSLSELIIPVAYALIAVGIAVGAISLVGCIGGCYTIKIVLIVYAIATSAILLVQLIFVILAYSDKSTLDDMLKPYLEGTLDDYAGIEGTDSKSLAWNALMNYEKCCGVTDYTDFQNLQNWPASINGANYNLQTPVICCKSLSTSYTCAETPTDSNNYWKTGCYEKLFDVVMDNAFAKTFIAFFLAAQGVLIFFTLWIICTMNNMIDII